MARSKSPKASKSRRRHKSKKDKTKSKKEKKHASSDKSPKRSKSKKDKRKHRSSKKKGSKSKSKSMSPKHSQEQIENDSGPPNFGSSECANALLVLQSGDKQVTIEALRWFEKHLAVDENVKVFVCLKGIEALLQFINSSSSDFLQRSSLKILNIVALTQPGKLAIRNLALAKTFIDLTNSTDEVVQEHATSILASFASLYTGRIQLLQNNIIDHISDLLNHSVEAVAKNTAEILWYLLDDPLNMDFFLGCRETRKSLLNLISSKDSNVCFAALCVLERLAKTQEGAEAQVSDEILVRLRKNFRIPNADFAKSHRVILNLLTNLIKVPSAFHDLVAFIPPAIGIICGTSDESVLIAAVEFIGRLCSVSHQARIVAEQTGFTGKLVEFLACDNMNIVSAAILASAEITAADYSKTNKKLLCGIESLLDLLHLEGTSTANVDRAISTISHLLTEGEEAHEAFLKFQGKETLVKILNSEKYSEDALISSLTCIQQLGLSSMAQLAVADDETVASVLKVSESEANPQIIVAAASALSAILGNPEVQKEFWVQNGNQFLSRLVQHDELQVITSALPLLQVLSSTFEGQLDVFNCGVLQILLTLKNKSAKNLFQPVLQKMLNAHLPLKFSLSNHLDWTDVIGQGFYDSGPAYCSQDLITSLVNLEDTEANREKNILVLDLPDLQPQSEHLIGPEDEIPGEHFSKVPLNSNTTDSGFENLIASLQSNIEMATTEQQVVKIIAHAVSDHCGGAFREQWKIGVEMQELELATLQTDHKLLAIPLSMVKVGALRPRAVLFKAFADRLGIRCTLERGSREKYWNVVFLQKEERDFQKVQDRLSSMMQNVVNSDVTSCGFRPSTRYTETVVKSCKFVVDLMYQPGSLIHLGSEEWEDYCH